MKKIGKKLTIIAIAVFTIMIISGIIPGIAMIIPPDTTGHSFLLFNVGGNSYEFFNQPEGHGMKDLLDSTSYVTSWAPNGLSEKIVVQGQCKWATDNWQIFSEEVKRYWYVLKFDGSGSSSIKVNGITLNNNQFISKKWEVSWYFHILTAEQIKNAEAQVYQIQGDFQGKIIVEFWIGIQHDFEYKEGKISSDEAWLRSGIGKINVLTPRVEEGSELKFSLTTGYSHSEKSDTSIGGWICFISNPNGMIVHQFTGIEDNLINKQMSWLVPKGSFNPTPGASNTYYITLRNELLDQDQKFAFIIAEGMMTKTPKMPTIILSPDSPRPPFNAGDKAKYIAISEATMNPISHFLVWFSKTSSDGQTLEWIYQEKQYIAERQPDGTYTAVIEITYNDVGYYLLQVSAVDSKNLNSDLASLMIKTWGSGYNDTTSGGGGIFDPFLISAIIILISGIIISIIIMNIPAIPQNRIIGLFIMIIFIIISYLTWAGYFPILVPIG